MYKITRNLLIIGVFVLLSNSNVQAAKTAHQQAQSIIATGMIYGQMASENLSQYVQSMQKANEIDHPSEEFKNEIDIAVKKAEEAIKYLNESLKNSNTVLSVK